MEGQFVHLISKENDIREKIDSSTRISSLNDDNNENDVLYFSRIAPLEEFMSDDSSACIDLFSAIYILSHYISRKGDNFHILFMNQELNDQMESHKFEGEYLLRNENYNVEISSELYEEKSYEEYIAYLNYILSEVMNGDLKVNEKLFELLENYTFEKICSEFDEFLDKYYEGEDSGGDSEGDSEIDF